jgi:hypothetical protein
MTISDTTSTGTLSPRGRESHPRIVLDAGLISERRDGTRSWCSARPEGLEDVREHLAVMWLEAGEPLPR